MKLGGYIGPIIAILIPFLLFELLRNSSYDLRVAAPHGHFYIVSIAAVLAMAIGVAIGMAGSRLRSIKVIFLSLAFISLAGIFAIHGLSTPGFLHHLNHLPPISAQLSIILATFWLWLSSLSSDHVLVAYLSRWKNRLIFIWTAAIGIFGIAALMFPLIFDYIPLHQNPLKTVLTISVVALNGYTLVSYFRSYRYTKFPLQLAIVYSSCWFIVSQLIMAMGETWRLSWWLYHLLLLASMLLMITGFIKQFAAQRSVNQVIHSLFTVDPLERITNCISPSVKALILATESKDTYTAGHNFRVTMYALRIGEELKLPPEQLRALVQGAIVHDVGKINIPDSILNKPGALTDEERAVIETHPEKGYDMCRNLGFMKEELEVIRHHHERWDGKGYPARLKGESIPLLARIAAVADVYDALTSKRAYRQAWSHEEAVAFLNGQKGSHFDAACVEAWVRVCERDPQAYQYPAALLDEEVFVAGVKIHSPGNVAL